MNVLGLHTMGHDTGLCYFVDGRLAFAIETERLTRCRHDHRVEIAIEYFLERAGVCPNDIDLIAVSTNMRGSVVRIPDLEKARLAIASRELHYETSSAILHSEKPCLVVAHEACHAALATHYGARKNRRLALVNEGRGTFSRNSLFVAENGRLTLLDTDMLPWYGTGFGWSALGYAFGFDTGPGVAGTLMALAGHAVPCEGWSDLILSLPRDVHHAGRAEQERALESVVSHPLFETSFASMSAAFSTLQHLFGGEVERLVTKSMQRYDAGGLALGGGCALNVILNSQLRDRVTSDIAIAPASNDAGQALGAAVYALEYYLGVRAEPIPVYANGVPPRPGEIEAAIRRLGLRGEPYDPRVAADVLARGGVVAFLRGMSELGPRALGHRSLLANPAVPAMRERVSEQLKHREWFRPLAPVMRQERFEALFPGQRESQHMLFNYMLPTDLLPEATHVDGTARIQTVREDTEPVIHQLLSEFEDLSGVPGLINTSLNVRGRAIALTPEDVLADFSPDDIDLFVFEDVMAYRSRRTAILTVRERTARGWSRT